tara:strand:+ start:810 stop:1343 length:534 start_codon:yes stop_codon:yes gene_type:complete
MPTATPFTALGRGNGFPLCVIHGTDSAISAATGSEQAMGILRREELSLTNTMKFIWNLYSVGFPDDADGNSYSDSILRYGVSTEIYSDQPILNPLQRVCVEELNFSLTGGGGDKAFIAETLNADVDTFARFQIHGVAFATDTSKYYLMYMAGFYADDRATLRTEIPFANLTFNYYTY